MADDVRSQILFNGTRTYVVKLTNQSDGTGESGVTKIDLRDVRLSNGDTPGSLCLEEVVWSVAGFNYVTLFWDRKPEPIEMLVLKGNGYLDFTEIGGYQDPKKDQDGTGNILLTTDGGADGSSYQISLCFKPKK